MFGKPQCYASDKTTAENMNQADLERLIIKLVKAQQNMEASNTLNLW